MTRSPGLWRRLEALIRSGDLRASEEVRHELTKKDDGVLAWALEQEHFFVGMDDDPQDAAATVLLEHPRLIDTGPGRSGADPFVIALALVHGCSVVTGEMPSTSLRRPKIPDVCRAMGVKSMKLLDLIRDENWIFR